MSTDGGHRRRKRVKRHRTDSSSLNPKPRKHESSRTSPPDSSKGPATLEDLRNARVAYLTSPPAEKERRMRYEYVKTVKVKESGAESRRSGSTVSKSKSAVSSSSRKKKSRSAESTPRVEEADEFVYRSSRSKEEMPGAYISTERKRREEEPEASASRSRSKRSSQPTIERRNTEPSVRQLSRTESRSKETRPALQKSRTTEPKRSRTVDRDGFVPDIPGSLHTIPEVDTASIATVPVPKKPPSIFGSLFAPKPQPPKRKASCLTCGDEVVSTKTAKLPCAHRMCHTCLERVFRLATTDPAHMPPRCCTDQAISLVHVETLFDRDFKENYNKKLKEYKAKNRVYCPARGCGEWIQPKHMKLDKGRKIGKCPECKTYVCGICSQKMHKTRDCPKDPATKEFVETAKKAGWQKCYNCNAMVELKEGCNHMTCRCTAEFCMVCGLKWKSCDCPWFSYEQVDVNGDPVRYQQEIDRRREQELRDEVMARRMEALQLDDDQPVWNRPRNTDNAPPVPNDPVVEQLLDREPAIQPVRSNRIGEGLWNWWFGTRETAPPVMPGGWDDGPHQFEQLQQRSPRRRVDMDDPAAADFEQHASEEHVPVIRHRMHHRRDAAPNAGVFEGRQLTDEEREQERRIRAWATAPHM